MQYQEIYDHYLQSVEDGLNRYLPYDADLPQSRLIKAMRYSIFCGGKRIRPILLLEFNRICGGDAGQALPFACALEMIHCYSLIHDDLPCMDNDDIRRGMPANHKAFGEYTAVLAGDSLLTLAFEIIMDRTKSRELSPQRALDAAYCIASASGAWGMAGGQMIDMGSLNKKSSLHDIENLQALKTGALIRAAALAGCIIAGACREKIQAATKFGEDIGLAFQLKDDLLNVEGNPVLMGKRVHSDENKATFISVLGIDGTREKLKQLTLDAEKQLEVFQDNGFLFWLTQMLADRDY